VLIAVGIGSNDFYKFYNAKFMNEKHSSTEIEYLKRMWEYIWSSKEYLGIIIVLSGIIGYIQTLPKFSLQEYRSSAVIVPPNLKNAKSLTFLAGDFQGLGIASPLEMEKVAAAIQSENTFRIISNKFNLAKRYNLAHLKDEHTKEKELRNHYLSCLKVRINKKSLIQIEAFDEDPKIAQEMVQALGDCAENFVESVVKRNEGIVNLTHSLDTLLEKRKFLMDSLEYYRKKLKIYRIDKMSEVMASEQASKFMNQPTFHQNYDKLINWEDQIRDIQYFTSHITVELERRKENLKVYPKLVSITSEGVENPILARPNKPLHILLSSLGGGLLFMALTVLRCWWSEEEKSEENSSNSDNSKK